MSEETGLSRPVIRRAIDRAGAAKPIPGNRVALLQDGPEVYAAMLAIIAGAQKYIHFENYIIRDDDTGWRFARALAERAGAGVKVRVLYDWLGCISTSRKFWRFLREAGCEVRCFCPPDFIRPWKNLSRDHRKLVVADGPFAVVGGLCIADEWAGDPAQNIPPWRDTAVLIEGPASAMLDQAFARIWALVGPPLAEDEVASDLPAAGNAAVRVVQGEPGRERAARVIEYLAAGASERLWMVDAYLVPPPRLFEVMALAERDGVDIRLLVPGASDVPVVRNVTRLGYRDILRSGMRIFEWNGPMIHAKTMVADGRWVRIGTSNINLSSLVGNYELDVVIEDAALAEAMELQFRKDCSSSVEVIRQPRRGPDALKRVLPSRLALQESQPELSTLSSSGAPPTRHERRGKKEGRTRAVVAARRLASGAFRSIVGPLALLLLVVGVLFLGLPHLMSYLLGAMSLVVAGVLALQVWRRREW
ncbi:MAG TPA: phosphatidylserine/phosphatidylglycerophosphate/cardiolipin synthase family protein [Gemmatimonadales bacterium]|nr:phosphatidylserine/phosphatidylglycerophosphate/cardiolipin synthase family protein [Gemmatimonadales bacterium]